MQDDKKLAARLKKVERQKKYRETHREHDRAYQKAWYAANCESVKARQKRYREEQRAADPEGFKRKQRESNLRYRLAHPEEYRQRGLEYYKLARDVVLAKAKERVRRNKELYGPAQAVLGELRRRLGWTQKEAAAWLGVKTSTYGQYETGALRCDVEPLVEKLKEALDGLQ